MASVDLHLGVGQVRQLIRNLKELSAGLRDSDKVKMEQMVCASIAEDVRMGIASIQDVDGNYLGSENPNASVTVEVGLVGHDTIWRGTQIAYLEFGTGRRGATSSRDTATAARAGYHADPTKVEWAYLDDKTGKAVVSHGIEPQAPMYNAAVAMRRIGAVLPARLVLKEALQRAVTL